LNGILYVLTIGCSWNSVPGHYGMKSTVRRFHLHLGRHGLYDEILAAMRRYGYDLAEPDLSCCAIDTTTIPGKKGFSRALMVIGVFSARRSVT
jgi:transposase